MLSEKAKLQIAALKTEKRKLQEEIRTLDQAISMFEDQCEENGKHRVEQKPFGDAKCTECGALDPYE